MGGKEDDENYVVTPGSSCQRSSAQRPRIRGGCGRTFSCAPRVLPRLPGEMGEKEESTELKPYKRVQVDARIIRIAFYIGCSRFLCASFYIEIFGLISRGFVVGKNIETLTDFFYSLSWS